MSKSIWKKAGAKASRFAFEKKVAKNKKDPQALKQLGISAYKDGDLAEARKRLDESVKAGGKDPNLWRMRGLVYSDSRRKVLWDDDFKTILKYSSTAYESFEHALRHVENLSNPDTLLLAGRSCEAKGEWERCIACYSNIVINYPRYVGTNVVTFHAACVMAQAGQFAQACGYMEAVLQQPPEGYVESDAILILARLYEITGRKREANDSYQEVFRQYKKNVTAEEKKFHGTFQSWRSWYKNPSVWFSISKRFARLECPIFAADAAMEAAKRGFEGEDLEENGWVLLARMRIWLSDSASALQSLTQGLTLQPYHMKTRKFILELDKETWTPVFAHQDKALTDIQRVFRGTLGRKKAFLKKTEADRLARGAVSLQKIFRGKKGRKLFLDTLKKTDAVKVIQHAYRGHYSKFYVENKRQRRDAARKVQRFSRWYLWRKKNAIEVQKIIRGYLGRKHVIHLRLQIKSAIIIQSCFRSYYMRQIAKRLRALRDGAVGVQRIFRGQRDRRRALRKKRRRLGAIELQRLYRGHTARKLVRSMKDRYATLLQKNFRAHRDRKRVSYMRRTALSKETPTVRLMRMAAMELGCTWLASRFLSNREYLMDSFQGEVVVSETNLLGTPEAKVIAALLFKNRTLRKLIIARGRIGDEGMEVLATALQFNTVLETLAIGPNNITGKSIGELCRVLQNHNFTLENLILEGNKLSEESAILLGSTMSDFFVRNYGKLKSFTLCKAGVRRASAELFGKMLYMNKSLLRMDLSGNHIHCQGARVIFENLKRNSVLLELSLDDNNISFLGAQALTECMQENTTLRICSMQHNLMLDNSAQVMLGMYKTHPSLRALRVSGNPIGQLYIEQFEAIGKYRSSTDIKEIMDTSIASLPPLIVSPGAKRKRAPKGNMSPARTGTRKNREKSKAVSPLSSPLVLSPYLHPSPQIAVQNTPKRIQMTYSLPENWNTVQSLDTKLTRPTKSVLGTAGYPLPKVRPMPPRVKGDRPFPVLFRPPKMTITPISKRDREKIEITHNRHVYSRKSTAEINGLYPTEL
jgi:tetratricopeptide (TPR) repeat protein